MTENVFSLEFIIDKTLRPLPAGYRCPRCMNVFGDGIPGYYGSDPVCGFTEDGKFNPDNWACETLMAMRDKLVQREWCCDSWVRTGKVYDGYIFIMCGYKSRGTIDSLTVYPDITEDDEDDTLLDLCDEFLTKEGE